MKKKKQPERPNRNQEQHCRHDSNNMRCRTKHAD